MAAQRRRKLEEVAVACLRQALKDGWTQVELAKAIGMPQSTISAAVNGTRRIGSLETVDLVFQFFGVATTKPRRRTPNEGERR